MFEPARLWIGCLPAAWRIEAIIPAVVVLPFVELTTIEPRPSLFASRSIASGAIRTSTRPGSVVPPPRPLTRLSVPTAFAVRRFASNRALMQAEVRRRPCLVGRVGQRPGWHDHAQRPVEHAQRRRQVGQVLAVGVDGEVAVGVDLDPGRAPFGDLVVLYMRA